MIINKVHIKKFRGFEDVDFELGKNITVITGQNGTQKTTLLGMLTQTFSITKDKSELYGEKPLCGGNFKSAFKEKFRLSETFDKPEEHEWTLFFDDRKPFTVASMPRGDEARPDEIRFWQKGKRGKGDGYLQFPVIFLSLKRLYPSGEDKGLEQSDINRLEEDEVEFFRYWHNKILAVTDELTESHILKGRHKDTLGVNTNYYDWKQNSAGQDNIGKILLAVLSFKRLQEKHPEHYKGGILAIDELDATLYPASQLKLLNAFKRFSSDYKIQMVFTTHSLSLIEKSCELQQNERLQKQVQVVFLRKWNDKIKITNTVKYPAISNHLQIVLAKPNALKIQIFTEDNEARIFAKVLLKSKITKHLNFINCNLSCSGLTDLVHRKIPPFVFPKSIVMLDGDADNDKGIKRKIAQHKNVILLPGRNSPERIFAEYLRDLDDEHPIWDYDRGFDKQYCFNEVACERVLTDRNEAKSWFNKHYKDKVWGVGATKLINYWIKDHKNTTFKFVENFKSLYNLFAKELNWEKL